MKFFVPSFLILFLVFSVFAQTPAPLPTPTPAPTPEPAPIEDNEILRVSTEEVSLNVRVVDGRNRPINNLKETQFKIYEDGVLVPITSFNTTEVPIINAILIDNSRSLRSQLAKVVEAGKIIIGANRTLDETLIVRFVSKDKIEEMQNFTNKKTFLENALDNLYVEGGETAVIDAVYQTAKRVDQYQTSQKKEDAKFRSLIVISDGSDRGSSKTEQELFELLRRSNVQIYGIGFIDKLSTQPEDDGLSQQEKAKSFLTRIASETGGKVYFPGSINELPQIATEILGELRTQYLINYSPEEGAGGSYKKIKVIVDDGPNREKRTAITRSGRTVAVN